MTPVKVPLPPSNGICDYLNFSVCVCDDAGSLPFGGFL